MATVVGLVALRRNEPAFRQHLPFRQEQGTPIPSQALLELDRMLAAHTEFDLETAWSVVRALGKRAPEAAKQKLVSALEADEALQAPGWADADPKVAIAATLLETRVASESTPLCAYVDAAASQKNVSALGLSWGVEYLALCAREGNPKADRKRIGSLVRAGIKSLERTTDPRSLEYSRLAQSLFRAAPLVADRSQALELRRVYGRLSGVWSEPASVTVEGARLEAAASFALLSVAAGSDLDANLVASLRAAEARMASRVAPSLTATEQSAVFRALRWAQAALEKTAPSGSTSGADQPKAP